MSELERDFVFLFSINIYGDSVKRPSNLLLTVFVLAILIYLLVNTMYLAMHKAIYYNIENKIYNLSVINVHHVIITLCDLEIKCIEIYNVVFNIQKNSLEYNAHKVFSILVSPLGF